MQNPDKPVVIPERRDDRKFPDAPEFVRNVMGSSAGAGSGEFHVYRHLRRKEYARQRYLNDQARREEAEKEFEERVEAKKRAAEEKTAKKRAKRLKRKKKIEKPAANASAQGTTKSETCEEDSD